MHFIKGRVEDTIPQHAPDEIALLRLDTDWYSSTHHELVQLYPRLQGNGVLVIDDYGWWQRDPPAKRIKVEDGIKARSKRGAFATKWWAQRWLAVLEGFNLGARLQRGRTYARGGQVLGTDIAPGRVVSYSLIKVMQGKGRDVHLLTYLVSLLFIGYFVRGLLA